MSLAGAGDLCCTGDKFKCIKRGLPLHLKHQNEPNEPNEILRQCRRSYPIRLLSIMSKAYAEGIAQHSRQRNGFSIRKSLECSVNCCLLCRFSSTETPALKATLQVGSRRSIRDMLLQRPTASVSSDFRASLLTLDALQILT